MSTTLSATLSSSMSATMSTFVLATLSTSMSATTTTSYTTMTNSVAKFEQSKKMKSGANALKTMGQICKNYGAKWSKLWGKCAKNYGANLQRASNTQSHVHIVHRRNSSYTQR